MMINTCIFRPLSQRIPKKYTINPIYNTNRRYSSVIKNFWKWTSQDRPSWRENSKEAIIMFVVFGLAGSSSMILIRPTLKYLLGIDGPFLDSPISYTVSSILIASPMYACVVFTIGTLAGRHIFFANMARKVVSRFLPKTAREKITCPVTNQSPKKGL